ARLQRQHPGAGHPARARGRGRGVREGGRLGAVRTTPGAPGAGAPDSPGVQTQAEGPTMRQKRQGFTLVEMLVAMALTIFIMVIMSEAFVAGLETFRQLKAIGDMS